MEIWGKWVPGKWVFGENINILVEIGHQENWAQMQMGTEANGQRWARYFFKVPAVLVLGT